MEILFTALAMLSALALGYFSHCYVVQIKGDSARESAERILRDSRLEAEVLLRESEVRAKEQLHQMRDAFDEESRERRKELLGLEQRIDQRETNHDRKVDLIDKKEAALEEKLQRFAEKKFALEEEKRSFLGSVEEHRRKLQEIAGLSMEQARSHLLEEAEEEIQSECGALVRQHQETARETAEFEARKIITHAIERFAADQVSNVTTSVVHLGQEGDKGRIIGKEGRNIRSLESETGVNFLIDDTPDVVVVSGFDPLRREIARQSLVRLLDDGRINPSTIEQTVAKVRAEMDESIRQAGEEAVIELGLRGVAPDVVRITGRLKYRNSFAQNVLKHSIEMAHLMAGMAGELGLDVQVAKRVGLFHDIGKALDHEVEGGHATIGADLLRKHGEDPVVVNAVAAHHRDVEAESLYAHLCIAADAITAARPGARADSTQVYLQRLQDLEKIAQSFPGVEKCYAIQAGRELRVIVEPDKIDDDHAMQLARNISKRIEESMQYPGQIRITVIRETRSVEYAK